MLHWVRPKYRKLPDILLAHGVLYGAHMPTPKWSLLIPALFAFACGGTPGEDSDTDDLSATTYSMEMVRANPALLPGVTPPAGQHVDGRGRPLASDDAKAPTFPIGRDNWLYDANGLNQFLKLTDPAAFNKTDAGDATYSRQPGDLLADGDTKLAWLDVEQGYLGDCYFAASLAAVLFADNGGTLTQKMIVPHMSSGKVVAYDVTFFQASGRKVKVEVDPDLLHRNSNGHVYYMRDTKTKPGYEVWSTSLVEKAYAKWHGSYKSIGGGGTAADAIYALTGKRTKSYNATDSGVVAAIDKAGKAGKAQVACTYGEHSGVKYPTGIYADHCYTLRGIHHTASGDMVMLRNPWGPGAATDAEPTEPPTDGVPDALFEVTVAQFGQLWASVDIVP